MKILMVCLGNICRSPLAEGLMQDKLQRAGLPYTVDSAGISQWHAGESPDPRSIDIAARHHIDIANQRARKINSEDLRQFDLILAMDKSVYNEILSLADTTNAFKVKLFLEYAGQGQQDVPDPWYGGEEDFHSVYRIIDHACTQIAHKLLINNA